MMRDIHFPWIPEYAQVQLPDKRVSVRFPNGVTGGSEGIGYGLAELFIDQGAKVTLASRNKDKLRDAALRLQSKVPGAAVLTCPTDVGSREQASC